jgi:hypothetical protein
MSRLRHIPFKEVEWFENNPYITFYNNGKIFLNFNISKSSGSVDWHISEAYDKKLDWFGPKKDKHLLEEDMKSLVKYIFHKKLRKYWSEFPPKFH